MLQHRVSCDISGERAFQSPVYRGGCCNNPDGERKDRVARVSILPFIGAMLQLLCRHGCGDDLVSIPCLSGRMLQPDQPTTGSSGLVQSCGAENWPERLHFHMRLHSSFNPLFIGADAATCRAAPAGAKPASFNPLFSGRMLHRNWAFPVMVGFNPLFIGADAATPSAWPSPPLHRLDPVSIPCLSGRMLQPETRLPRKPSVNARASVSIPCLSGRMLQLRVTHGASDPARSLTEFQSPVYRGGCCNAHAVAVASRMAQLTVSIPCLSGRMLQLAREQDGPASGGTS